MNQPPSQIASSRSPLTDSPWFWLMIFSAAGVVLLLVILPRYAKRQRRLEMQYYARREIERRQVEGTPSAREPGQEGSAPPPGSGELIIPLWPLVTLLAALLAISATMLWRNKINPPAGQHARRDPP